MSEIDELAEKYLEAKLKAKDREYEQGIHQARVSFIGSLISFLVFFALAVVWCGFGGGVGSGSGSGAGQNFFVCEWPSEPVVLVWNVFVAKMRGCLMFPCL